MTLKSCFHFDKMNESLQESDIRTDGLFLNADAGFDIFFFRNCLFKYDIIDNIDFNRRNRKNDVSFFDNLFHK